MRSAKLGVLACVLSAASASFAGITLVSGPGTLRTNPNDMKYLGNVYMLDTVNYWTERENHRLTSNLVVSMLDPGSYPTNATTHFANESNTIASGTAIDSYYLYYDPSSSSAVARFRFDRPILGIMTNERTNAANDHFMLSDYLIDPAVPVANRSNSWFEARGLEISGNEYIRWLANNEIEVHLNASNPGDQIRVITAAVPEPGTVFAIALGAVGFLVQRRRKSS